MRIGITADLHVPITDLRMVTNMVKDMVASEVDVAVLAGDIGESRLGFTYFEQAVKEFTKLIPKVCVIAGNHDLWGESQRVWDKLIPEFLKSQDAVYLEHDNFYQDNIAIVGSMIHYDYSAAEISLGFTDEYYAKNKGNFNNDGNFLHLQQSDKEFNRQLSVGFLGRLRQANGKQHVKHIVGVTHVPCFEGQMVRKANNFQWAIANAYFGCLTYSSEIRQIRKLHHFVSAHTHTERNFVFQRKNNPMNVYTLDSDYRNPSFIVINTGQE